MLGEDGFVALIASAFTGGMTVGIFFVVVTLLYGRRST